MNIKINNCCIFEVLANKAKPLFKFLATPEEVDICSYDLSLKISSRSEPWYTIKFIELVSSHNNKIIVNFEAYNERLFI